MEINVTDAAWSTLEVNGVAMGVEFAALDEAVWVALQDETTPVLSLEGTIDAGGVSTLTLASLDRGDYIFRITGSITVDAVAGIYDGTFSEVAYLYDDGTTLTFGDSGSVSGTHGALVWSGRPVRIDTDGPGDDLQNVSFANTGLNTTTFEISYFGLGAESFTATAGTTGNDTINGGIDDDSLGGAGGNDNISGLGGNDTLDGGLGKDILKGGAGDDTYLVDLTRSGLTTILQDTVTELANAGTDTLVLRTPDGYALASAFNFVLTANVENLDFSGAGSHNFNATGNALGNAITGNAGNNSLSGGVGIDALAGGGGNDIYLLDKADELALVTELADGGTDTLRIGFANASRTVPVDIVLAAGLAEFENLTIVGAGLYNLAGNAAANVLTGNGSVNRLVGGAGADTMVGLAGNDVYVVDDLGDKIIDASGIDTVETGISWSIELSPTLEHITLTGGDAANAMGNALANVLTGNAAINTLTGLKGNDIYVVQNAGDVTVEALAGGTDVVKTTVTYALGDNVENLILQPEAGDIGGTGNLLVNTITGNTGNNTLDGAGGRDVLKGGAGNDTYIVDLFRSGAASVVQDTVSELVNGGNDTLALRTPDGYVLGSAFTALLPANVENLDLSLTGALNINATGNTVSNILVGNDGNNLLNGMGGADSLDGGGGNDILVWDPLDTGYDGGAGVDTLRVDGKNLTLDFSDGDPITGVEVINITGTGNNTLVADAASVVALSGDGVLRIDGNAGDVVNKGEGWTHGADQVIGANTYRTFTQGEATLLVDTDIRLPGPANVPVGDAVALTGDPEIDGLVQGGAWTFPGDRIITYSLNLDDETPRAWTVALTAAIDKAFATWAQYINVGFQRVESGKFYFESNADISLTLISDATLPLAGLGLFPDPEFVDDLLADVGETRGTYPRPEGDIVFNLASRVPMDTAPFVHSVVSVFGDLDPGEVGFYIMLHEIGHALGLKHPNDDGLNGRPTFDSLGIGNLDQLVNTLMVDDLTARGYFPATPMVLDVAAVQAIYGANPSAHAGDDIYHITPNLNFFPPGGPLFETIWDTGGTDTLVVDPGGLVGLGFLLDLTPGGHSGPNSVYYLGIAEGVLIENAVGGAYGDDLIGNGVNNSLDGGAGNDEMEGHDGNDTLVGGTGNDSLNGGAGNDVYIVDASGDQVSETDGGGADTIFSSATFTLANTAGIELLELTGNAAIHATGSAAADLIRGNSGANSLSGGSANDTLEGGAGDDTLQGGEHLDHLVGGVGNDVYLLDDRDYDIRLDLNTGTSTLLVLGEAFDPFPNYILTDVSYDGDSLADYLRVDIEDSVLPGSFAIAVYGPDGSFAPGTYTNALHTSAVGPGHQGPGIHITLFNFFGSSSVSGEFTINQIEIEYPVGDDPILIALDVDFHYVVEFDEIPDYDWTGSFIFRLAEHVPLDTVVEATDGGRDRVVTPWSYTLAANVEDLELTGDAASAGTGNALDNRIAGNSAGNVLVSGGGTDTFTGGAGGDTFVLDATDRLVAVITDFAQGEDVIGLGTDYEALFDEGELIAGALLNAAAATDAAQRLLYDDSTGNLYYDADGSEAGAVVHVATLATGLTLTADDFTSYA